jgi:hypothetical protein
MAAVLACARCQTPLKGPANPNPDDALTCLTCGQSDSFDNAWREATEFLQELARQAFDDELRDALKDNESVTITETPRPERSYRFIFIEDGH